MSLDAERIAARMAEPRPADLRAYLLVFHPEAAIPPLTNVEPSAVPLIARVNHDTWIASCDCRAEGLPAPGCIVWLGFPYGWCIRCENAATGGRWRPIALPPADVRDSIEAILRVRPYAEIRNWEPGETADQLIAENLAHNLEAGV